MKILALVIVVVVVVFTGPAGGWAALGTMSTTAALGTVAFTAAMATLALTVYSMALSKYGEPGGAAYVGRWIKVFGLVSLVTGVMAAFNALIEAGAKVAAEEGATTAVVGSDAAVAMSNAVNIGEGMVVDMSNITAQNLIDGASNMFMKSMGTSSWLSKLSMASKVVNPIMEWRQGNLQKELTSMSEECKAQQAALAEEYPVIKRYCMIKLNPLSNAKRCKRLRKKLRVDDFAERGIEYRVQSNKEYYSFCRLLSQLSYCPSEQVGLEPTTR
jgi:hypothetical protein